MIRKAKTIQDSSLSPSELQTLWQIGRPGDGSKEFLQVGNWTQEYHYTVGVDPDPINNPSIPALLTVPGAKKHPKQCSTDKLNIHFRLERSYNAGELIFCYNFYGSEEDSLFIDGQLLTKIVGIGEGKLNKHQIPLLAITAGNHTLSITTSGGVGGKHSIDYLRLQAAVAIANTFIPKEPPAIESVGIVSSNQSLVSSHTESQTNQKQPMLATGLEDYGTWAEYFKDHKPENDPPYRRGRIWA